tara:strand:+ start:1403 stop:2026 length:624 start_codon:yes stop_codon:yes gene_type:complete
MYKTCSQCKKHQVLEDFHKLKKGLFGRHSICKICRKNSRIVKKNSFIMKKDIYLVCSKCNEKKPCSDFYINRSSNLGYQSCCKNCQKIVIAKSMSKIENYSKIILKKFIKKHKKKKINITFNDIVNKYNRQCGICAITKHKMTHTTDIHQRTDNIWNMSIYSLSKTDVINVNNFQLVIHFVYTAKDLYKLETDKIIDLYKNLIKITK